MSKHLGAAAACAFFLLGASAPFAAQQSGDSQQQSSSTLSRSDQRYFTDLAKANLAEIEAGKLALDKAGSEAVKTYAKHMVDDHGKMLEEQRAMGARSAPRCLRPRRGSTRRLSTSCRRFRVQSSTARTWTRW